MGLVLFIKFIQKSRGMLGYVMNEGRWHSNLLPRPNPFHAVLPRRKCPQILCEVAHAHSIPEISLYILRTVR